MYYKIRFHRQGFITFATHEAAEKAITEVCFTSPNPFFTSLSFLCPISIHCLSLFWPPSLPHFSPTVSLSFFYLFSPLFLSHIFIISISLLFHFSSLLLFGSHCPIFFCSALFSFVGPFCFNRLSLTRCFALPLSPLQYFLCQVPSTENMTRIYVN